MIYAKIINEDFSDHKYHVALHFYGADNACKALSQQLKEESLSPMSFLAAREFMPISDTLFVLNPPMLVSTQD